MTKNELLALANVGKTEINGYPLEVKVSLCADAPWIVIYVDPLSPLHQPLILGQKWVEYVTEEECAELPEWLDRYKREADDFCRKAKRVVKATLNDDGTYTFTDVPETVKEEFADQPQFLKRWLQEKHSIKFIDKEQKFWYAPDVFTLDLDGVQYEPHWSYWLETAYYITQM
jgi:hypothetical protein